VNDLRFDLVKIESDQSGTDAMGSDLAISNHVFSHQALNRSSGKPLADPTFLATVSAPK
jgi:hypothetical protein